MTLSAIVNGTEYSLDDGTYCYWVGDDGLGMAPMHRLSERGPLQHGDTDRGFRLDPRTIRLMLDIIDMTRAGWEGKRASLLDIFRPLDATPIIIKLDLSTGERRISTYYVGSMSMPSSDRLGWNQTVVIDLLANDPSWYDPTAYAITFANVGGGDGWAVPWDIPWTLGASDLDESTSINYLGTWICYPQIRITGPVTDLVLTNDTTGEKLDFTGVTIAAGHYYDLNLSYGYKTVELDDGTNEIASLTSDSDLATWHLEPGTNSISATGSSITAATKIEINYRVRYIGV